MWSNNEGVLNVQRRRKRTLAILIPACIIGLARGAEIRPGEEKPSAAQDSARMTTVGDVGRTEQVAGSLPEFYFEPSNITVPPGGGTVMLNVALRNWPLRLGAISADPKVVRVVGPTCPPLCPCHPDPAHFTFASAPNWIFGNAPTTSCHPCQFPESFSVDVTNKPADAVHYYDGANGLIGTLEVIVSPGCEPNTQIVIGTSSSFPPSVSSLADNFLVLIDDEGNETKSAFTVIPAFILVVGTGACCDRRIVDPLLRCRDGVPESQCIVDDPTQVSWTEGILCQDLDPACTEHTGACCDEDTFGSCQDNVPASQCNCKKCLFYKGTPCSEIECVHNPIPTVSEWGLMVLALLLLTGAKLAFRRASRGEPADFDVTHEG